MSQECNFTWDIKNFQYLNNPNGHSLESCTFWIDKDIKWQLKLYPRGDNHSCVGYLSLFLLLVSLPEYPIEYVSCEMTILNANNESPFKRRIVLRKNMQHLLDGVGYPSFIDRRTLINNGYLIKGSLQLFCKVTYSLNNISLGDSNGFSKMFMSTAFSDVTFEIGNKKFPAHKAILAAKSPKLNLVLRLDTSGTIMIVDVAPEIFEKMLYFMYTGTVMHLDKYAKDLVIAAENYQIHDLRDTCVDYLIGGLTVENAIEMVQFAQECRCRDLEDKTIAFINDEFVKETPDYLVWQLVNILRYSRPRN